MSTEEQRRAARAARLGPVQGPPEQVPGQQPLELETPMQGPPQRWPVTPSNVLAARAVVAMSGENTDDAVRALAEQDVVEDTAPPTGDDAPTDHSSMVESETDEYVDPRKGDNASDSGDESDDGDTVRHDAGETDGAQRPVIDDGKAAGEAMRRERERRGRAPRTPGHGWLDVDAFTEHLRTARLRPIGSGQATVNVRVSAELADALEKYRQAVEVSKRDVVEALLVELVGPPAEGGRR